MEQICIFFVASNVVSYILFLNFYVEILHLNTWVLENVCLYPQDYIEDNDSLILLHDQIHDCDIILSQIGSILSGFQVYTQPVYALFIYFLHFHVLGQIPSIGVAK